jgi:Family of unknown function (DUF6151)
MIGCHCGAVRLKVIGPPIMTVECGCTSCQTAGAAFAALPGARSVLTSHRTTPYVMMRKDRVEVIKGSEHLAEHRLTPSSKTRRVVATCCNTPVFLEFQGGHWLSIYSDLWPEGTAPKAELRTMTRDLPDRASLPSDVPNAKTQSAGFMWALLKAWVSMGFRSPKIDIKKVLNV